MDNSKTISKLLAVALAIAALCRYGEDADAVYEMLDFLKGPESLSNLEKQFLRDRLGRKAL